MTKYKKIVKFGNKEILFSRDKDTIRIRIKRYIQIINNILYMSKINSNLLFIIALNKKDYKVRFSNIRVKIINIVIERIVTIGKIRNNLYQITKSTSNKAFISNELLSPSN